VWSDYIYTLIFGFIEKTDSVLKKIPNNNIGFLKIPMLTYTNNIGFLTYDDNIGYLKN